MSTEAKKFWLTVIITCMAVAAYLIGMYPVALLAGLFGTGLAVDHFLGLIENSK